MIRKNERGEAEIALINNNKYIKWFKDNNFNEESYKKE